MKIKPGMTFTRQGGNTVTVLSVSTEWIVFKVGGRVKGLTPERFRQKMRLVP